MATYPSWITRPSANKYQRNWNRTDATSRLCDVKAIAIHYTEAPGQNAYDVADWFFSSDNPTSAVHDLQTIEQGSPYVGVHFIIDDNQILAMSPDPSYVFWHVGDEISRAANRNCWNNHNPNFVRGANFYTIGIEHCHADVTGRLSSAVLKKSHQLVTWLKQQYGKDILIGRHYDFSGKNCPIYCAPVLIGKNDKNGTYHPEFTSELVEVQIKSQRWRALQAYYKQANSSLLPEGW